MTAEGQQVGSEERAASRSPDRAGAVEHLTAAECWSLLEGCDLGRLAVVGGDGTPELFPVNYTAHEGSLFFRTARDSKLLHIAHHPSVAFEIDGETDGRYWSVVAKGAAERVTSDALIRDSGVQRLASLSPTVKHFVVRIGVHAITGRRFAAVRRHADPLQAFEGDAGASAGPEADARSRSQRPEPIPHRRPTADSAQSSGASRSEDRETPLGSGAPDQPQL
ncbi:pyridoxamine 5'-phosphate oxidase family protein [Microbacterium sp. AZCO]|uniref:pyridoxamine 5'-phosphate oxidase family protein n=1 Tax=Microbacterium sp. AZCO TaxID=3142976 RepID=UPI0031F3C4FF